MTIDSIINQDDKIEQLSDIEAIDAWVRFKLMRNVINAQNPRFVATDLCDKFEQHLSEFNGTGIYLVVSEVTDRNSSLARGIVNSEGPDNALFLFKRWTNSEMSVEDRLIGVRSQLRTASRQIGMPDTNVARDRVKYHSENDIPEYEVSSEDLENYLEN